MTIHVRIIGIVIIDNVFSLCISSHCVTTGLPPVYPCGYLELNLMQTEMKYDNRIDG